LGAKGFEVDAVASSAVMTTMVAVCVLALATVTAEGARAVYAFPLAALGLRAGFDSREPLGRPYTPTDRGGAVHRTRPSLTR
jgi:hypothetical protein